MTADLLVIGGGPAGSTVAIAARRKGLSVCLVERARPPFRKVCGEFLSNPGMEVFERLTGISRGTFPRLSTVVFRSVTVRGSSRSGSRVKPGHTRVLRLDPPAWGVRRSTLDTELLNVCAASGVDLRIGWRAGRSTFQDGAWSVDLHGADNPGRLETVRAARLVRAGGRRPMSSGQANSWVGRRIYTAADAAGGDADVEICLVPGGGYYGRNRVEDSLSNLCGLTHDGLPAWRLDPAAYGVHLDGAANGVHLDPANRVHLDPPVNADARNAEAGTPRFRLGYQMPEDPSSFAVGDALATWPPLAGDGMTMAMISADRLGACLADPAFKASDWTALWHHRYGGGLKRSLAVHSLVGSERWKSTLIGAAALSRSLGEWIVDRTRFVEA